MQSVLAVVVIWVLGKELVDPGDCIVGVELVGGREVDHGDSLFDEAECVDRHGVFDVLVVKMYSVLVPVSTVVGVLVEVTVEDTCANEEGSPVAEGEVDGEGFLTEFAAQVSDEAVQKVACRAKRRHKKPNPEDVPGKEEARTKRYSVRIWERWVSNKKYCKEEAAREDTKSHEAPNEEEPRTRNYIAAVERCTVHPAKERKNGPYSHEIGAAEGPKFIRTWAKLLVFPCVAKNIYRGRCKADNQCPSSDKRTSIHSN